MGPKSAPADDYFRARRRPPSTNSCEHIDANWRGLCPGMQCQRFCTGRTLVSSHVEVSARETSRLHHAARMWFPGRIPMIKRRVRRAGLATAVCCHSFQATGITCYLLNGGSLEHAQRIAAYEYPRTTKLYDRTSDEISLDEIERIII